MFKSISLQSITSAIGSPRINKKEKKRTLKKGKTATKSEKINAEHEQEVSFTNIVNYHGQPLSNRSRRKNTLPMMKVLPQFHLLEEQKTDTMHFFMEEKFNATLKG